MGIGPRMPKYNPHPKYESELNQRDIKTLDLLSQGYFVKDIAEEFNVGYDTMKRYAHRVFIKMGADNACHAVAMAIRRGLIQ